MAGSARVNAAVACNSRVALGRRIFGDGFVLTVERGLIVGRGALAGAWMIVVRRLRDRPAEVGDRFAADGRRRDRRLVLERYGDRRKVGLGAADSVGQGLGGVAR